MVYKYCYSNSYLTKKYVEESVTDIMKHPVYIFSVSNFSYGNVFYFYTTVLL